MQISMNQGPGLSERNWLTEGCHPCAWKMMDPICKLLLRPSALYLLRHWLLNTVEILSLLKNNKWFGKIGTLTAILSHCAGTHRGSMWFQWWQAWLLSWSLFFHLPFSSSLRTSTKWNQYLRTSEKNRQSSSKILAFACWTDNILFLAIVMLGPPVKGIYRERDGADKHSPSVWTQKHSRAPVCAYVSSNGGCEWADPRESVSTNVNSCIHHVLLYTLRLPHYSMWNTWSRTEWNVKRWKSKEFASPMSFTLQNCVFLFGNCESGHLIPKWCGKRMNEMKMPQKGNKTPFSCYTITDWY